MWKTRKGIDFFSFSPQIPTALLWVKLLMPGWGRGHVWKQTFKNICVLKRGEKKNHNIKPRLWIHPEVSSSDLHLARVNYNTAHQIPDDGGKPGALRNLACAKPQPSPWEEFKIRARGWRAFILHSRPHLLKQRRRVRKNDLFMGRKGGKRKTAVNLYRL